MVIKSYAISGPGHIRAENQDNLFLNGNYRKNINDKKVYKCKVNTNDSGLFAVADGMGGGRHGELASLIAVEDLKNAKPTIPGLTQYLIDRNNLICNLIKEKTCTEVGTTFAGVYINTNSAVLINIGDSRVYLFREGRLVQLSHDHTGVQQMIDYGIIDRTAADNHRDKHKLTQYLGIPENEFLIEPFMTDVEIKPDDIILLCSDGLTDMLADTEIEDNLTMPGNVLSWADSLYSEAMVNGGKDNITIVLLQILSE